MSLRTGDLSRRITIQSRSSSVDTFGQQVTTWSDLLTCWAQIEPLQGRELMLAQAINAEVTHRVTILYRSTVTAAHRIVYATRVFNIQSVMDMETAHESLQLLCSEGLNQG